MRAIMVAVDYTDILRITLPYNIHHFSNVCIVTDHESYKGVREVVCPYSNKVGIYKTDAFTRNGATFNKWLALEEGLDFMGREGWLCLMDADVLWPNDLQWGIYSDGSCLQLTENGRQSVWSPGHLISPLRRMFNEFPNVLFYNHREDQTIGLPYPIESEWKNFPIHRNVNEWAGYTQIFHADDPVLNECANCRYPASVHSSPRYADYPPICKGVCNRFSWHQTDWIHAGGADSFFQGKWPRERKIRPPFEVLHLGPSGRNWYGRSTPYVDGTEHPLSHTRDKQCMEIWDKRRERKSRGLDPFERERI